MSRPSCQTTECMACRAVRASTQPRSRAGLPDTPGPGGKQSACCIHPATTPTAVRISTLRGSSGTRISNSLEVAHRNRVEICLRDVPTFRPSTLERSAVAHSLALPAVALAPAQIQPTTAPAAETSTLFCPHFALPGGARLGCKSSPRLTTITGATTRGATWMRTRATSRRLRAWFK